MYDKNAHIIHKIDIQPVVITADKFIVKRNCNKNGHTQQQQQHILIDVQSKGTHRWINLISHIQNRMLIILVWLMDAPFSEV